MRTRGKGCPSDVSTTCLTIQEIVERERDRLRKLIVNGLDPVYGSFDEFLSDFYPDFSWNEVSRLELQALLDDTEWFALAADLKVKRGYNFPAEIERALKEDL